MVTFLFWNLARNPKTSASIGQLAVKYGVDVFVLAECPPDVESIIAELDLRGGGSYRKLDGGVTKVKGISRLATSEFLPTFTNWSRDLTIWNLKRKERIQLTVVHIPSKVGGGGVGDQQSVAEEISQEIAEYEDKQSCQDTVLVGDLNMKPFDPGMVIVSGFHAAMTRAIAGRPDRTWRRRKYRRFYNPMWGLFGDRTPGPPGTHYWKSSATTNQHWHMFDQVLLRPSMVHRLILLDILDHDGHQHLVSKHGVATKKHLSDHLPILFSLDI